MGLISARQREITLVYRRLETFRDAAGVIVANCPELGAAKNVLTYWLTGNAVSDEGERASREGER